ncbi:MAG: CinA family protein [Chloroflexi bacterium]|nr:CinA family protein [Chloroflexota bacterium]
MGVDRGDPTLADLVRLAQDIQVRCLADGTRVATAESCTGGLIGHALTEVAGSSDVYLGGIVSYDDEVKASLLGVQTDTLARHGAVSAQVAVAMADGARRALGATIAIAVTGIAGPGGGSAAKPVGLTYVAVADKEGHDVRRHQWSGDRATNKLASAQAALVLLLERLAEPASAGTTKDAATSVDAARATGAAPGAGPTAT